MKDSVRALAADFKAFLASREEDDLTPAACPQAAAPAVATGQTASVSPAPQPTPSAAKAPEPQPLSSAAHDAPAQDHLTISFLRQDKQTAPNEAQTQPQTDTQSPSAPLSEQPSPQEAPVTPQEKQALLDQIAQEINACRRCPLGQTRLHAVPGEGNPAAELMFIGEGPGFDEDHQGRPFIGRAGQLLDKMIAAMGLKREQVFIANIAKCHPMVNPENPEARGNDRAPNAGEIAVCRKYIERQIAAISPKYVVALGGVAAKALISDTKSLGALRGKFHLLHLDTVELKTPVKILATYHPAALLRNPAWKKDAWADLQMVMAEMGLKRPQA